MQALPADAMSATPLRGSTGYAFDLERLLLEAANSVYATRNQVTARGIRQLWHGLCNYINVCLKSRKVWYAGISACSSIICLQHIAVP